MSEQLPAAEVEARPKRNPIWMILIWGFVIVLLGLLAIQLVETQQGTVQVGSQAPEFVLTTFEGEQINTADLRGKVILVNFWASWCNPCEDEAPELQSAWEMYEPGGRVVFLGVDWTDTDTEAREYMERFGITYPSGPDYGTRISQDYRTTGVPETYVIDQNGMLAFAKKGPFASLEEIISVINPLLGQ